VEFLGLISFIHAFSSGIRLLGLVHGEGEGEAISSSLPVWVGTLTPSQFLEF
jgi:hypothetical protein